MPQGTRNFLFFNQKIDTLRNSNTPTLFLKVRFNPSPKLAVPRHTQHGNRRSRRRYWQCRPHHRRSSCGYWEA